MKRTVTALLSIAAACSLGGCYVSLHSLVTSDVRVYEPGLVGAWVPAEDEDDTWTFAPSSADSPTGYRVDVMEDGRSARFYGELARLDGQLVLDLTVRDQDNRCEVCDHNWFQYHMVSVHSFLRVTLGVDTLKLVLIDGGWLDQAVESKKITIAHEHPDDDRNPHDPGAKDEHNSQDRTLLTAPTRDLQKLVRDWGRSGLFDESDAGEFTRRK